MFIKLPVAFLTILLSINLIISFKLRKSEKPNVIIQQPSNIITQFTNTIAKSIISLFLLTTPSFETPTLAIEDTSSTSINSIRTSAHQNLKEIPVYFGIGCFWHVQHEFISWERELLHRSDEELSSIVGYAGGLDLSDPVCYHNMRSIGDYGQKGYAEVVSIYLPADKISDFTKKYVTLFIKGERPDKLDIGPEYRSLIGLPDGSSNEYYSSIKNILNDAGLQLVDGSGNDPDTLLKKKVYLMDSNKFPFKQGEIYHQFHDGFMPGEQYPEKYNSLVRTSLKTGRIQRVNCPDINIV